jgi:hypothetical protein
VEDNNIGVEHPFVNRYRTAHSSPGSSLGGLCPISVRPTSSMEIRSQSLVRPIPGLQRQAGAARPLPRGGWLSQQRRCAWRQQHGRNMRTTYSPMPWASALARG